MESFQAFAAYAGFALGVFSAGKSAMDIWRTKNERQRELRKILTTTLWELQKEIKYLRQPGWPIDQDVPELFIDSIDTLHELHLRRLKSPSSKHLSRIELLIGNVINAWWAYSKMLKIKAQRPGWDGGTGGTIKEHEEALRKQLVQFNSAASEYIRACSEIDDQQLIVSAYLNYRFRKPK